ncbi:hypothetical protein LOK49_LG05G03546 [Camellia lanceoleosa]|uniref:Uncharacterized protein n=1 Tax=Camellia lanceoleosa TaxID=1840588 RepID=A0ACC0HIM7_9ERIC|nr:hypothetical protein LOK49_LG05G03546 [Camellia lanceoleosa]
MKLGFRNHHSQEVLIERRCILHMEAVFTLESVSMAEGGPSMVLLCDGLWCAMLLQLKVREAEKHQCKDIVRSKKTGKQIFGDGDS